MRVRVSGAIQVCNRPPRTEADIFESRIGKQIGTRIFDRQLQRFDRASAGGHRNVQRMNAGQRVIADGHKTAYLRIALRGKRQKGIRQLNRRCIHTQVFRRQGDRDIGIGRIRHKHRKGIISRLHRVDNGRLHRGIRCGVPRRIPDDVQPRAADKLNMRLQLLRGIDLHLSCIRREHDDAVGNSILCYVSLRRIDGLRGDDPGIGRPGACRRRYG